MFGNVREERKSIQMKWVRKERKKNRKGKVVGEESWEKSMMQQYS